jgi:hypothetical protein
LSTRSSEEYFAIRLDANGANRLDATHLACRKISQIRFGRERRPVRQTSGAGKDLLLASVYERNGC